MSLSNWTLADNSLTNLIYDEMDLVADTEDNLMKWAAERYVNHDDYLDGRKTKDAVTSGMAAEFEKGDYTEIINVE